MTSLVVGVAQLPSMKVGVERAVVVPSPSCPLAFEPQQSTPPPVTIAQVCSYPAVAAVTPEVRLSTSPTGCASASVVRPSWPTVLEPQHRMPPALVRTQVWRVPAVSAVPVQVQPAIATGVYLWIPLLAPLTLPLR